MSIEKKPLSLKLNKEYKRAYYRGKSRTCPYFVCYVIKNRGMGLRYDITASKKMGNAVMRNRARRLIRTAFFSLWRRCGDNLDFVFVARERILELKSYEVAAYMESCIADLKGFSEKTKAQKKQ